jgi:hypothetical protein
MFLWSNFIGLRAVLEIDLTRSLSPTYEKVTEVIVKYGVSTHVSVIMIILMEDFLHVTFFPLPYFYLWQRGLRSLYLTS